jgi:hypothetical protein
MGPVKPVEERQARHPPPPGRQSARDRGKPAPPPPGSPEAELAAEAAGLFQPAAEKRAPQDWLERLRAAATAPPSDEAVREPTLPPPAALAPVVGTTKPATPPTAVPAPPPSRAAAQGRIEPTPRAPAGIPAPPSAPRRAGERLPFVPPVSPPPAAAGPSAAESVAPAARRFLAPLLGIDPGEVEVMRGPEAEAISRAHDADAVTRGETIVLGDSTPERSPEGLGLLAHELTHVARQRDPRFVPPVLKALPAAPAVTPRPATGHHPAEGIPAVEQRTPPFIPARPAHERPARDPEEVMAERVESTVRTLAAAPSVAAAADSPIAPVSASRAAASREPWGSLPAPWEPMPDFSDDAGGDTSDDAGDAPEPGELVASATHSATETYAPAPVAAPAAGGVQRAARDRRGDDEESSEGDSGGGGQRGPDVDALARQVYGILKRRIAAERRRGA